MKLGKKDKGGCKRKNKTLLHMIIKFKILKVNR